MKTFILLFVVTCGVQAQVVTLLSTNSGPDAPSLTVEAFQTAELLSFPVHNISTQTLQVEKDGYSAIYTHNAGGAFAPYFKPLVIAGPAKIRVSSVPGMPPTTPPYNVALATFRLTPEPTPPDRTILVPPGTNQARITLEYSTNLVHWFSATNGVYGPLPEAKFFRIKLEPVP